MRRPLFDRYILFLAIGIVVAIVHVSLYPYLFSTPSGTSGPVAALMQSWSMPPTSLGNLLANVLLYMPFGFFAALALRCSQRLIPVTLVGLALSTMIEVAQFYDRGRVTNLSDVYLNTFGTMVGAASAILVRPRRPFLRALYDNPIPHLLLIFFCGYRLLSYIPKVSKHEYWPGMQPVMLSPRFAFVAFLYYFTLWLSATCVAAMIIDDNSLPVILAMTIASLIAAKILIINTALTISELIGALVAVVVWLLILRRMRWASLVVALIFLAMIVVIRLEPFNFHTNATPFGWVPFRSFVRDQPAIDVVSLFDNFFVYGSLIWIATKGGLPLWLASLSLGVLLFATSLGESYLPGHSAEITDAVMALLIGATFAATLRATNQRKCA